MHGAGRRAAGDAAIDGLLAPDHDLAVRRRARRAVRSPVSAPITSTGTCAGRPSRSSRSSRASPPPASSRPPASAARALCTRPVAVAVGLHDRAQLRARRQLAAQPRAVALDRGQVDCARRPRCGSAEPPSSPAARAAPSPFAGCSCAARRQRFDHVARDHRLRGARRARREPSGAGVQQHAAQAAANGVEALGEQRRRSRR